MPDIQGKIKKDKVEADKRLKHLYFYLENCNRNKAEEELKKGKADGVFLVRPNRYFSSVQNFVLSVVINKKVLHFEILLLEGLQYGLFRNNEECTKATGLDELIDRCRSDESILTCKLTKTVRGCTLPPPTTLHTGYTDILHRALETGDKKHLVKAKSIIEECALTNYPYVNMRDLQGLTALHIAAKKGQTEIVELLLKQKTIEHSAITWQGATPLHLACQFNHIDIVNQLISAGADIMPRCGATGNYPIHLAAQNGHLGCIKILLSRGACAAPRNNLNETPQELASGHKECVQFLDDYVPPTPPTRKDDWYHGKLTRQEVELKLNKRVMSTADTDGLFLVRDSSSGHGYVLTTIYQGKLKIYQIQAKEGFYYIDLGPYFHKLENLIHYYCLHADGINCRLRKALNKDGRVQAIRSSAADDELYATTYGTPNVTDDGVTQYTLVGTDDGTTVYVPFVERTLLTKVQNMFKGHLIDRSAISLETELGQGEFGSVMRGKWSHDNQVVPVAIKTLHEKFAVTDSQAFLSEAEVMVKLNHECIVKFIGVCNGPPLMIVQELMETGSLLDFLLDYPTRINDRKDIPLWAAQIACGMKYLATSGFIHRDLAARNILLASKDKAKVGDFGLSRTISADDDIYQASKGGRWPIRWYAPEAVNFGSFSHASDVWSYGVTLWEMFTFGDQPYGTRSGSEVVEFVGRGGRLEQPDNCPNEIYQKMIKCWQHEPSARCTFTELHQFFNSQIKKWSQKK